MSNERARIERVFEELVEGLLRGEPVEPEAWLARHPELDEDERARLRVRARVLAGTAANADLPFERLGGFRLLKKLGEGGMGVVYLARDEALGRLVALKLMRPELAGSEAAQRRFEREARAIGQLRHPHVVTVYATGVERGVRFLALEYLDGRSLAELLRAEGPLLAPARVVRWGRELAEALAEAHRLGITHRDVKPSNVHVDAHDRALLLDFGLAQLEDALSLAASGAFRGTPYYAAPEQVESRGRPLDGRADVYALGATLYECLTGRPPFEGATSAEVFHAVLTREPRRPRLLAPDVSRELETVLLKTLEKEPERRYASAGALAADLAALLEMRPIAARPPGPIARALKWARRNRGTCAGLVLALGLLVLFTLVLARQRFIAGERFRSELAAAESARAEGDHEGALAALERALALRPAEGEVLAQRERVRRESALARAAAALARARTELAQYRAESQRLNALTLEAVPLRQAVTSRPMGPDETRRLARLDQELADLSRSQEGRFAAVLEALDLARALDPEDAGADAVLAELYLERWRAARAARDARGERHYRALVARHDRAGTHAAELDARVALTLASTPAGAEVFLFRYEEQALLRADGEPRLVPVPIDARGAPVEAPLAPGSWALRVVRGTQGIEAEDLVLTVAGHPIEGTLLAAADGGGVRRLDRLVAIDGRSARDAYDLRWRAEAGRSEKAFEFERAGERFTVRARQLSALVPVLPARELVERGEVPVELLHAGARAERNAPAGLELRVTAAPLVRVPANRAGTTPLVTSLPQGSYLALLRAPGFEPLRVPFVLERERALELAPTLAAEGTSPPGFVRIAAGPAPIGGDAEAFTSLAAAEPELDDFWIQEGEVGMRAYAEFVNDFATLAEIDAAPTLVRVPHQTTSGAAEPLWSRNEDGTFEPEPHTLDQPVHGLSWEDAAAYARWRTARAQEQGLPFEFALPSEIEWEKAARGADRRAFPFGETFVPRWVKGYFAREQMLLEPAFSFPIDESPYGVFDLTGSLWEWCADDWDAQGGKGMRGGAFNFTFPPFFRAASRAGQEPGAADGIYGLRLVARRVAR